MKQMKRENVYLQSLGVPGDPFGHSLQAQPLAVHMWAGAAALVWASIHGYGAQQQRGNKSPKPAERCPRLLPALKHRIHVSSYFQSQVQMKHQDSGEGRQER